MKCKHCKHEMSHIDDEGGLGSVDYTWDEYICTNCLATVCVSRIYIKDRTDWRTASYEDIQKAKRCNVKFKKGVLEDFINA